MEKSQDIQTKIVGGWARSAFSFEMQSITMAPDRATARRRLLGAGAALHEIAASGLIDKDFLDASLTAAGLSHQISSVDIERSLLWSRSKGQTNPRAPKGLAQEPAHAHDRRNIIGDWFTQMMNDTEVTFQAKRVGWAMASIATKASKTRFSASVRLVSELSGVEASRVSKAVRELRGWISIHEKGTIRDGLPTVWQLSVNYAPIGGWEGEASAIGRSPSATEQAPMWCFGLPGSTGHFDPTLLDPSLDIWRRRPMAWWLAVMLHGDNSMVTCKGLAQELGTSAKGLRKNMQYLEKLGFIAHDIDGWWERISDLEEGSENVADQGLLAHVSRDRRIARHAMERKAYEMLRSNWAAVMASSRRRRAHEQAVRALDLSPKTVLTC